MLYSGQRVGSHVFYEEVVRCNRQVGSRGAGAVVGKVLVFVSFNVCRVTG